MTIASRMNQIILKLTAAFVFASMVLSAQNSQFPTAWTQLFDDTLGTPCSGCKLYTYQAGGTTPEVTYTTANGSTPNANPVVLDSAGAANVWTVPGVSYRLDLYSALGVLIRSVDHIPGGSLVGSSSVNANYVYAGPTSGSATTPTFRALTSADLGALSTACTNQFLVSVSSCVTAVLASAQFANQGTTVTVAHGNASGNPSWGSVVGADFGSSIAARTALVRAAATAGAPAFGTTVDALAYQVAEIPNIVYVTTDFTTASTSLTLITGLTWTIPASTALNVPFTCNFVYNQATAAGGISFGIQDVTVSPTNIAAEGIVQTNTGAYDGGVLVGLNSTTATTIVTATPSATGTDYTAQVTGFIQAPSNASASAIDIMVDTGNASDSVTVRQGSYCRTN